MSDETMGGRTPPAGRRKLRAGHAAWMLPLFVSIVMTFIVSGISTLRSVGLSADLLRLWPQAWGLSWLVGFPVLLVVMPAMRRLVGLFVEPPRGP